MNVFQPSSPHHAVIRRVDPVGRRCNRSGFFTLPCSPDVALALFTPEGERDWVPDWTPTYLSGATDEAGAVWTTDAHGVAVTWVTVIREEDHVRYARLSSNGTAGFVDVRCAPADEGTRVRVEYDLTATSDAGVTSLGQFTREYDDMLEEWRALASRVLA